MGKTIHIAVYFYPKRVMKLYVNWGTEHEDAAACRIGIHID